MIETYTQAYALLQTGGLMVGLIITVIAYATEKVVPGSRYQTALKRIIDLEYRLDRQQITTDRAITTTEAVVGVATRRPGE